MQNCTLDSRAHTWVIFGAQEQTISPGNTADIVVMGYTLRLVSVSNTAIVSSVSGTATSEKNNTMIVCGDGNVPIGQGPDTQEARIMVFGKYRCLVQCQNKLKREGLGMRIIL